MYPDRPLEALPASYTATLLFWSLPLATLVLLLFCFYGGLLVYSVVGFFNGSPQSLSLLGSLTGAYMLAFFVKALITVDVPQGIRLPPGVYPQLENLIAECSSRAGVELPDDVFIVPEANAFAYSSGRIFLHKRLNNYVLIGAPLLATLEPRDLAAVLFHEFGHLILRRGSWVVSLHHKIEDFFTRFLRAQFQPNGCTLVFTCVPGIIVALCLNVFRWSMAGFSKREELLVDCIAGRLMGEEQFREHLVRSITIIGALSDQRDDEISLVKQINAEFHRRLMAIAPSGNGDIVQPDYFIIARTAIFRSAFPWDDRLASVYQRLITKRSGPRDSHPSLPERVRNLNGRVGGEFPLHPTNLVHLCNVPKEAASIVSSGFGSELRAIFFKEKLATGRGPCDGMSAESVVEFRCRFGSCSRNGRVEIAMTQEELFLSSAATNYRFQWHEISKVGIFTGGTLNGFMTSARNLNATFREAPSERVLRFTLMNSGMIEFPHWHVFDNMPEVEALVTELCSLPRVFGRVTDESGRPVPGASVRLHDEHGAVGVTASTREDGRYSLASPSQRGLVISVRAQSFAEASATYESGKRCKVNLVLREPEFCQMSVATLPATQNPEPNSNDTSRLPRRANVGTLACLAFLLKLTCALGFLLPVVVATNRLTAKYEGAVAVTGWCSAVLGWRLGSRLATKHLLTTRRK
jgi:Zn-dependent protease with chaperone function